MRAPRAHPVRQPFLRSLPLPPERLPRSQDAARPRRQRACTARLEDVAHLPLALPDDLHEPPPRRVVLRVRLDACASDPARKRTSIKVGRDRWGRRTEVGWGWIEGSTGRAGLGQEGAARRHRQKPEKRERPPGGRFPPPRRRRRFRGRRGGSFDGSGRPAEQRGPPASAPSASRRAPTCARPGTGRSRSRLIDGSKKGKKGRMRPKQALSPLPPRGFWGWGKRRAPCPSSQPATSPPARAAPSCFLKASALEKSVMTEPIEAEGDTCCRPEGPADREEAERAREEGRAQQNELLAEASWCIVAMGRGKRRWRRLRRLRRQEKKKNRSSVSA